MSVHSVIDWKFCVICQRKSSEDLRCPFWTSDNATVYSAFLNNVEEFRKLDCLPVQVNFGNQGTVEQFVNHNASWHKKCHQKFNTSMLKRMQLKKSRDSMEGEGSCSSRPKRQCLPVAKDTHVCLFCKCDGKSEQLHEFSTFNADKSVRVMATEMNDTSVLVDLADGDLVAIEAKYHLACLTKYRNRYRSHCRSASKLSPANEPLKRAKATAFAKTVSFIESALEEGTHIFKLAEVHKLYQSYLENLGVDITVNKSRLKSDLLEHFQTSAVQEQLDGKNSILVFPEGMHEMFQSAKLSDYKSEALQIAKITKEIRKEIFAFEHFKFSGSFPENCQSTSVPYNLKLLVAMLLEGTNADIDSQACLTITQLILFNSKKKSTKNAAESKRGRHTPSREPPLPLYLGLKVHALTRSKKLVEHLKTIGISVSYTRVTQVENSIALSMCKQFETDGVVCPSNLRNGLFTAGAMDNLDHNPSSTTAESSFHGTGISIIQFPTSNFEGNCRNIMPFSGEDSEVVCSLPLSYTTVPAVALNASNTSVPQKSSLSSVSDHDLGRGRGMVKEDSWLKHVIELLDSDDEKHISWAAFHAACETLPTDLPAITTMLPLFYEKADTPAMIKHCMNVLLQSVTEYLNPQQVPVLACDCPIFAKAKYIQWMWPDSHGEDKIVIMFGGLHLEMAMWNMLGDYLADSGWTVALSEAGIGSSGTVESFLKVSHLTRTRHAHQITVAALSKLQREAYSERDDSQTISYEEWRLSMIEKSPTFQFWDSVLGLEKLVLTFVRAHRERNFEVYMWSLELIVGYFFALDHYNYSRWVPIHIRDMKSLPDSVREDFKKHWVVAKTSNHFSSIPIDQVHEQENAKMKGVGGVIGLTENPAALSRWMVCGPEVTKLFDQFESELSVHGSGSHMHHEEGLATQKAFKKQTQNLIDTITNFGNPFLDDCPELLILNTRECADDAVITTVRSIETIGVTQYQQYYKEVIVSGERSIHDSIKKNSLPVFKTPKHKVRSKTSQQLTVQRSNASLFGRLYIANQQREGDPLKFFSHENQLFPPSMSDFGKLRFGQKSLLLTCLESVDIPDPPEFFQCKIFDGAAVVHFLPTASAQNFAEYATKVFIPFLQQQLQQAHRVDCIWDRYIPNSIKEATREHRGCGTRTKVSEQTKMPKKWSDFLQVSKNKQELFTFLSNKVSTGMNIPEGKSGYITSDKSVFALGTEQAMGDCNHEEADTRMVVHVMDSLEKGLNSIMIRTVDTDVIVILIGEFHTIHESYPAADIWIAFGTGKHFRYYHINSLSENLGKDKSRCLPAFHAFTGCDSTSSFFGKTKKSAWEAWNSFPEVNGAFLHIVRNPFDSVLLESSHFQVLERFTVILYDRTSVLQSVNEARKDLFCKRNKSLENLPPTADALLQHVKRAVLQAGIWTTCRQSIQNIPSPEGWGWSKDLNSLKIVWITIPEAARACSELIKCNCKSPRGCNRCKCVKAGLSCTDLCNCNCEI